MDLVDIENAPDKVPYERLMANVNAHGIQGDEARWIRNWLARRYQRVCINQIYCIWNIASKILKFAANTNFTTELETLMI